MKVSRMRRMTGIGSLLMALSLTATGCSMLPEVGGPGTSDAGPAAPPVAKVADYDTATVVLDPEWEAAYGQDRALPAQIAADGLKILGVMYDEFPNYTVHGFVPTDAEWNATSASLSPLVNAAALEHMKTEWSADKTLPVMTSYRSEVDANGVRGYTYTTEAGEKCTDSNKPYEYKNELITLTARPDESGTQVPIFSSNVTIKVHCQEGSILQGQMYGWFPMEQVNGKWIMRDSYEVTPTGVFKMEPAAG